jgi:predicted DNA-binding transcriptional regulator AlpA
VELPLSVQDIAEVLGISRQRVHELTKQKGFPKPVDDRPGRRRWARSSIERWAEKTGRSVQTGP